MGGGLVQRSPNTLALARFTCRSNPQNLWVLKMLSHEFFFPGKVSVGPSLSPPKIKGPSPQVTGQVSDSPWGAQAGSQSLQVASARKGRVEGSCNSLAAKET